jgi:hypothetical protein
MNIQNLNDALKLPKGSLIWSMFETSPTETELEECVNLIVENKVNRTFYTQAGIIEYAGNNLEWGAGGNYQTTGGYSEENEKISDTLQGKIDEVLALPQGRLVRNKGFAVEVSLLEGEVISAIHLIDEKETLKTYATQAEVIVHAGALGWGSGDVYFTC